MTDPGPALVVGPSAASAGPPLGGDAPFSPDPFGAAQDTGSRKHSSEQPSPWWSIAGFILFASLAPALIGDTAWYDTLRLSGIFGITVVGLSMLSGHAGQISLGQAGLVGAGAYGSAIATTRWDLTPMIGIGAAILLAVGVALCASPVLRLRGNYLALATLALGLLIERFAVNLVSWTGGNNGLSGIPRLSIGRFEVHSETQSFAVAWGLLVVALVIHVNINRSRVGRAMRAIHDDEDVARAAGVPAARYKVAVWLIAAGLAGVSGALYAHEIRFISPTQFAFGQSVLLLAAVVVGGTTSLFGPVIALVLLRTVPVLSPESDWLTPTIVSGVSMVAVMMFFPGGLGELWDRTAGGLYRRHARSRG